MKAPKARALKWWQRGLLDGKDCARKRRQYFFKEYLALAVEALAPGELQGPCECVYRCAFRYGYDAELEAREKRNQFYAKAPRRATLA